MGLIHEEILSGIEKKVDLYNVDSVQFTETDCIILVKDLNTKETLISDGITLKNGSVNFLDVEKNNHSYSFLLSDPGRFNYSIAFAMLASVYMRRMCC
jgi:hypothetical protein